MGGRAVQRGRALSPLVAGRAPGGGRGWQCQRWRGRARIESRARGLTTNLGRQLGAHQISAAQAGMPARALQHRLQGMGRREGVARSSHKQGAARRSAGTAACADQPAAAQRVLPQLPQLLALRQAHGHAAVAQLLPSSMLRMRARSWADSVANACDGSCWKWS